MTDLAPNMAILKSPSNWFLVGFSVALVMFLFYMFTKDKG